MILYVTEIEFRPVTSALDHNPIWGPRCEYFLTGRFISDGHFIGKSHSMVGKKVCIPSKLHESFGSQSDLIIGTLMYIKVDRWPTTDIYEGTMQIAVSELP